jgi:hypothetical protein
MRRSPRSRTVSTQTNTRIGCYLLAMFLLTIQGASVTVAEEALSQSGAGTPASSNDSSEHAAGGGTPAPAGDSTSHSTSAGDRTSAKSGAVSTEPQVTSPASTHEPGGTHGGPHNSATNTDSSYAGQKHDAGAIDAQIAPPTRSNASRFSAWNAKARFRIVAPRPRQQAVTDHTNVGGVNRNAIGIAVPPRSGKSDQDSKPEVPVVVAPAASKPNILGVKSEPSIQQPIKERSNISAPVAIKGSAIGGTANNQRGSGPAVIGGQSKIVAGINGSTITRRPH